MNVAVEHCAAWPTQIARYVVPNAPSTFFYIPDFISPETEMNLLDNIYATEKWRDLPRRRLQIWGGTPHPKGMIAEKIPEWLHSLTDIVSDLGIFYPNLANHVLINEYKPGQGIMPHHDGPLYYPAVTTVNLGGHGVLDFYSPITSETLDASLPARYVGSALLMPRSANIVMGCLYTHYMHGIEERENDYFPQTTKDPSQIGRLETTGEIVKHLFNLSQVPESKDLSGALRRKKRVSITIRHVLKTLKSDLPHIFKFYN